MQLAAIKATPNRKITSNKQLEVQNYDANNDYPQKVMQLSSGSGTVCTCLNIYTRFLLGKGIDTAGALPVGSEKLRNVLRKATQDYARFGGFALHVGYNALGRICNVEHIPFEFCRLGLKDDDGHVKKIAVNRDWLGIDKSPSKSNTTYCNVFDPDKALEEIAATPGGISNYNGQILYANPDGSDVYPSCIYEAHLTDAATQIACSNIRYRNAKNGFMPFGMITIRKTKDYDADVDGSPDGKVDRPNIDRGLLQNPMLQDIAKLQGDVNTSKMLVFELEPDDQAPEFKSLDGRNYDGAFKETESSTKANIGEAFMQPPILRCEQVSNGFADDVMEQAYKFYNTITEPDRQFIEEMFTDVFAHWWRPFSTESLRITPLSYNNATHQTIAQ